MKLTKDDHDKNNLSDIRDRLLKRHRSERENTRTAQGFCISKLDIAERGYGLSINRYNKLCTSKSSTELRMRSWSSWRALRKRSRNG